MLNRLLPALALVAVAASPLVLGTAHAAPAATVSTSAATPTGVYRIPLEAGVAIDDAAESMRLRANALNLKLVAELPLSKQVEAVVGTPQPPIIIFQFCDAVTAKQLIDVNLDFAIYMPCRIALIEDKDGKGWLVMMDVNIDAVSNEKGLSDELKAKVLQVRKQLEEVMQAGARGDL
jgi:uncharacterized protein (DUF302 family)